jgi:hypothetical protein
MLNKIHDLLDKGLMASILKARAQSESTGAANVRRGKRKSPSPADGLEPWPVDPSPRIEAVIRAATDSGLLGEKTARIGIRVSPALVEQAKRATGIEGNTELIEFALANIALVDDFARVFKEVEGTVDPSLDLGY